MFGGTRRVDFSFRDRYAYQKSLWTLRRAIFEERTRIVRQIRPAITSFRGSDSARLKMINAHPALQRRIAVAMQNEIFDRKENSILMAMQVSDLYIVGFGNFEHNANGHECWFANYTGPADATQQQTPLKFEGSYFALGGVPGYDEKETAASPALKGKTRVRAVDIHAAVDALSRWEFDQAYGGNIGRDMASLIVVVAEAAKNTKIEDAIVGSFRSAENQSGLSRLELGFAQEEFTSWDRMSRQPNASWEKYPIARLQLSEVDQRIARGGV